MLTITSRNCKRGDDYKCFQLLNFFPFACPNLVEFREKRGDDYKRLQLLKFSPFACPNLVEFKEIAKEVMITNAYNYLNFPPVPAQILLNLEKLPKR